jgi:hypothetical protein
LSLFLIIMSGLFSKTSLSVIIIIIIIIIVVVVVVVVVVIIIIIVIYYNDQVLYMEILTCPISCIMIRGWNKLN